MQFLTSILTAAAVALVETLVIHLVRKTLRTA
ncbi:hypothetical protein SAMN05421805_101220 [Saccharopolyspora antimicrobica]|uniref:Uncharacterized protein n=1 Tax=Saccharopolyspora antimicrobica TaxID=455193 RepID=A0A1I4QRD0_9PSEU|nr:hypothetical protein ATL45_6773 [Saccharopolyspora antimicrobica]SFM42260.1 hypothetical protein SAMN05421805_101220 [Saccharopolyspora antimicrobica]